MANKHTPFMHIQKIPASIPNEMLIKSPTLTCNWHNTSASTNAKLLAMATWTGKLKSQIVLTMGFCPHKSGWYSYLARIGRTSMRNTFESPPRARDFEQGCRHHGCPGEKRITSSPYPSYGKSMDMEDPPFRDLLMLANISKWRIPATCLCWVFSSFSPVLAKGQVRLQPGHCSGATVVFQA